MRKRRVNGKNKSIMRKYQTPDRTKASSQVLGRGSSRY
jgi:hypothetical protein